MCALIVIPPSTYTPCSWLDRMDRVVPDLDVSIRNVMTTACRSAPSDELCLQCIQLYPVAAHPPPYVVEAPWHVVLEQADISRLTPAVNMRIVRIQVGMQTMFGDQQRKIGGVQYKQQRSELYAASYISISVWCVSVTTTPTALIILPTEMCAF